MKDKQKRPVIFVTGLSGAGISTALKALEDCGYEVFDNFPVGHVRALLDEAGYQDQPVAFGFDSRTRAFSPDRIIGMAKEVNATILFLNATNAVLQKRFSETRRVHPLAKDRTVTDGIIYEREWLAPLKHVSNTILDTTELTVHDLKHRIESDFNLNDGQGRLSVTIMSFGFKNGVPREVDMMMDVRFLKNPHWNAELRAHNGSEKIIQDFVSGDPAFEEYYKKTYDLMGFLLPHYTQEGKSYFTLAFGCTGGKHRSVFLAEKLAQDIEKLGYNVSVRHRDLKMLAT